MDVRYAVMGLLLAAGLVGCASRPAVDVWGDAALVAEQAAVIAEQRRTLDDLGQTVNAIRGDLATARGNLDRAIFEAGSLREQWEVIDRFVRDVIDAERRLENVQQSNRGEDAGAGY